MLKETQRVLKTDGIYFAISYGRPEGRSFHFIQPFLSLENREFAVWPPECTTDEERTSRSHYIYVSKKLEDADLMAERHYESYVREVRLSEEAEARLELESQ